MDIKLVPIQITELQAIRLPRGSSIKSVVSSGGAAFLEIESASTQQTQLRYISMRPSKLSAPGLRAIGWIEPFEGARFHVCEGVPE